MDRRDLLLASGAGLAGVALSAVPAFAALAGDKSPASPTPTHARVARPVERHRIIRNFRRPAPDLLARLRDGISAGLWSPLSFATEYLADTAIKPIRSDMRIFGTALTVHIPEPDVLLVSYAMKLAKPGDVLVIDAGADTQLGCFGFGMAQSCLNNGVAGAVIDGAAMDGESLRGETPCASEEEKRRGGLLPVYARALTEPLADFNRNGSINVPIRFGGLIVEPGDLVVGGRDGVFILPQQKLPELLDAAHRRATSLHVNHWLPRVRAGEQWFDIEAMEGRLRNLGIPEYGSPEELG
jgi:4-hydroxy-4-methyl-2-oxoglutarate aldolase